MILRTAKCSTWLAVRRMISKTSKVDRRLVFQSLGIKNFSAEELTHAYKSLRGAKECLHISHVEHWVRSSSGGSLSDEDVTNRAVAIIGKKGVQDAEGNISYEKFERRMRELGEHIDPRVYQFAVSYFLTGTSVGIVIPCMPLIVQQLQVSPTDFGFIVSTFAFAKLISNVPFGKYVESIGRKPVFLAGLGMCAAGIGGLGLALLPGFGMPWIVTCRFITGVGVSGFLAGATMYITDISTALNRTRTNMPVHTGFTAGTAIGPFMGGVLIDSIGLTATYASVGAMIGAITALNWVALTETKLAQQYVTNEDKTSDTNSFQEALQAWPALLSSSSTLRNIVLLHGVYWMVYAGAQLTLLPLAMIGPQLQLSASSIGLCFASMSVTSVLCSYPLAYMADKFGKMRLVYAGCALVGTAVAAIPFTDSLYSLMVSLVPLAAGSTILSTIPIAHISNIIPEKHRAQALSLVRTTGDMGLLLGGSAAGILASCTSLDFAMQSSSALMWGTMAAITLGSVLNRRWR